MIKGMETCLFCVRLYSGGVLVGGGQENLLALGDDDCCLLRELGVEGGEVFFV